MPVTVAEQNRNWNLTPQKGRGVCSGDWVGPDSREAGSCLVLSVGTIQIQESPSAEVTSVYMWFLNTGLGQELFLVVIPSDSNLSLGNETKIITVARGL